MSKLALTASVAAAALTLAGCGEAYDGENEAYANEAYEGDNATAYAEGGTAGGTATSWPEGSRIVVEEGVTYRIDPGGVRVRLGPNDSRIVVEDGVRFRVDPDGARIRIDEEGAVIRATDEGVRTDVRVGDDPSIEVNTSR